MTRSRRNQRGMTIVELTVTIVLTGLIAATVTMFIVDTMRTYALAAAKADLLSQAQSGVERISGDVLQAAVADANNRIADDNSPDPVNPLGWVGDGDTLILATAAENASRDLLFADPAQYVTHKNNVIYYIDGEKLRRRVLANGVAGNRAVTTCPSSLASSSCPADGIVMEEVQSFVVTYYNHLNQAVQPEDARSVEVSVTLQHDSINKARVSYKTRTVFRND